MSEPHADLETVDLESSAAARAGTLKGERDAHDVTAAAQPAGPGRLVMIALVILLVILALWGVVAYVELTSVREDLMGARGELDDAIAAFREGDLSSAGLRLEGAAVTFDSVPGRIDGVRILPARMVPALRETLDAVSRVSRGAGMVASTGQDVTEAIGADEQGLGALTPTGGRIPIETFQSLGPVLAEAEATMRQAIHIVAEVPRTGIDADVRDARDAFLEMVQPVADQIGVAGGVLEVLPVVFGAEEPQRYMVVASNPAEARGSGGYYGAYTILEADAGQLSFTDVVPTQDLPEIPRGQIPWPDESLAVRYDSYGGSGFVVNLNMTPDFPAAATALENFYAVSAGEPLDGVIAVDPFAFEALLGISGPAEVPGYGTVGPEEVVEFVSRDAYTTIIEPEERKRLIGVVAAAALQGFLDSPDGVSAQAVLSALGEMVSRESILVHLADPDLQAALEQVGVTGEFGSDGWGDLLGVFLNSGSPSKVDYWLQRIVRYEVTLASDGAVAGILSAGFINDAPRSGEPIYMIGADNALIDAGDVLQYVSVYCPRGCRFHQVPATGFLDLDTEVGVELGHPVASTWMRVPSGRSAELVWSYSSPDGWRQQGRDQLYRLTYEHQPSIRPTALEVLVEIPAGHEATGLPDGAVIDGDRVRLAVDATRDLVLDFAFSPTS